MSRLIVFTILIGTSMWAPAQNMSQASTLGLQPITMDCAQAASMSQELEAIIAAPGKKNATWDPTLVWVGGINSPQQRQSSAKTVLWNIRTQCRGF